MIISNPKSCWKEIDINFYCRAPFQFNNYPSDSKCDMKKVAVYDVPHASSINDDQVFPCCGLFKLEKWEVCYHSCEDIIQPYRWQLLKSETSFCDICHKNCTSPADFVLHQECVHLCLPLFVCLSYFSFHLYYSILIMYAHYWISWRSRNSNFFNLEFRNCIVMLFCNSNDAIPLFHIVINL